MIKKSIDGVEYFLSKSKYMNGIQCPRLVYKAVNMPDDIPPPDEATRFIFDQGHEVGALAREMFPGGILIKMFPWNSITKRTKDAVNSLAEHIYEAGFLYDETVVLVDVLRRVEGKLFDIIEVKQSTRLKEEHIPDLAIQKYVVEGAGLKVNKTFLMHINKEYVHPGQGELLIMEDCTEEVNDYFPEIKPSLEAMKQACHLDAPPEMEIGPHCSKPRDCALMHECWSDIPKLSIFNIPSYRKKWELYDQGIVLLNDIPDVTALNHNQETFIRSYKMREPVIDKQAIKDELDSLVEPIYFLDFETVNWAVPKHDGMKAYRQMPFQWSIHVMDGGGEPEHKEFLWDNKEDPRKALADSLLDALGDKGTIVMYSSFERTALNNLAEELPEYRDRVDAVIGRLWDLLEIFRKYYIDANFGGNNSIKNVLPVLVPGEGYGNLEIQEGGLASAMFAKMISKEGHEKEKIRNDLLEYCKQDTQAMVDIYRALLEKIE
ncbi:MAG: DUF2779 domain-containing protein [Thermoplasmata archaeon]|nr:DUF2779 domain-containing protein [Thermoplasmata archaeon]